MLKLNLVEIHRAQIGEAELSAPCNITQNLENGKLITKANATKSKKIFNKKLYLQKFKSSQVFMTIRQCLLWSFQIFFPISV